MDSREAEDSGDEAIDSNKIATENDCKSTLNYHYAPENLPENGITAIPENPSSVSQPTGDSTLKDSGSVDGDEKKEGDAKGNECIHKVQEGKKDGNQSMTVSNEAPPVSNSDRAHDSVSNDDSNVIESKQDKVVDSDQDSVESGAEEAESDQKPNLTSQNESGQRSPTNQEGKKEYGRSFLLELQKGKISMSPPDELRQFGIFRDQNDDGTLRHTLPFTLNVARDILNNMTPECFEKILDQIREVCFESDAELIPFIDALFEKVISGRRYVSTYVKLCQQLQYDFQVLRAYKKNYIQFSETIERKCKQEFEDIWTPEDQLDQNRFPGGSTSQPSGSHEPQRMVSSKGLQNLLPKPEIYLQAEREALTLIRFIGELYNAGLLDVEFLGDCLMRLLRDESDENSMVCVWKLYITVANKFETETRDRHKNVYINFALRLNEVLYNSCQLFSRNPKIALSPTVVFVLEDVKEFTDEQCMLRDESALLGKPDRVQKEHQPHHGVRSHISMTDTKPGIHDVQQPEEGSISAEMVRMAPQHSSVGAPYIVVGDSSAQFQQRPPRPFSPRYRNETPRGNPRAFHNQQQRYPSARGMNQQALRPQFVQYAPGQYAFNPTQLQYQMQPTFTVQQNVPIAPQFIPQLVAPVQIPTNWQMQ